MKKTAKKLSINKETVASFEVLSTDSMAQVNGGTDPLLTGAIVLVGVGVGAVVGWIVSR